MPPNSRQLIEETDQQLADLQTLSLNAVHAMHDFVMASRAMETVARKLIEESRQLLADTEEMARGYRPTVYPSSDEPSETADRRPVILAAKAAQLRLRWCAKLR